MYVSLVPASTQKALWKTEVAAGKSGSINVKTSDTNFHLGALYYIIITSTSGKVDMTLTLNQVRDVQELSAGSDITYKQVYWTSEERAKFFMVQVPRSRTW